MKTLNFRITEDQKTRLEKDIVKFNKLADKLNCEHIELTCSDAELANDPHHKTNSVTDFTWYLPQVKFFDCVMSGGTIVAGDYTFIGEIHYSRKDDEVSVYMMDASVPHEYNDSHASCDHCNTNRKRNVTYVMKSNIDGSTIQVGSTCLRDFIGYDISDVMRALKFNTKFTNVIGNYGISNPRIQQTSKQGHQYGVREILMLTNAVVRVFGWAGSTSETHIPTADIVAQICDDPESFEARHWLDKVNEDRKDMTDSTMASEVVKWATDLGNCYSDYTYNVRSVIIGGTVSRRQFRLLCSAVSSFRANVQKKIAANAEYNNNYIGIVKEKLELEVKCIDTKEFPSRYGDGITVMYRMLDKDNHLLVWFSSSALEIPKDRFMKVRGTVKKHELFNHAKQTILTRVTQVK